MASDSMIYQDRLTPPPEDPRVVRLQQFLSILEIDVVPRLLFTRALQSKPIWASNGDLQTSTCESIAPRWLVSILRDIDLFSHAMQSLNPSSVSVTDSPVQFIDQYSIPSGWKSKHRGLSLLKLETLLFDVLVTVIQAFPNAYTEILWMEIEAELWDIIISTCMPFLAIVEMSDIIRYVSPDSDYQSSRNSSFWLSLASFVIRICTILKEHSPPSLQNLLGGINQLLCANRETAALPSLASLGLSIDVLSYTVWEKAEQANYVENLRSLRSTIHDQKSNAILGLAIARCHDELLDIYDFSSLWKPMDSSKCTAYEVLATAELQGTRSVVASMKMPLDMLPLTVRVLFAYQAFQDQVFEVAQEVLEGCIEEITATFGRNSIELLVSGTQLMNCFNSMAREVKSIVLAKTLTQCIISPLKWGVRTDPTEYMDVDGCSAAQSMRGVNFAIVVADSLLGLGEYDSARSILIFVWKDAHPTKTAAAMCLLRLLKINRRKRNETSEHDCLMYLHSIVPLLSCVTGELVFQCFEEVVCNLEAMDPGNASSWAVWDAILASLLLMDCSNLRISKPMMSAIEGYRREIVGRKAYLEEMLQSWTESFANEPAYLQKMEVDAPDQLVPPGEHHSVRLASLITDSLNNCLPPRTSSFLKDADSTNSSPRTNVAGSSFDRQERRLVIAIDYGTTYTGVAIATPAGSRAYLAEIDVIQDWGPGMGNHMKVPSVISYSARTERHEQQWGADLSPGALAMVHTKLELDVIDIPSELDLLLERLEGIHDLDSRYIRQSAADAYTRKGPEGIVRDYLARIMDYLLQAVACFTEELRKQIPVDIVATIPADWSYRAKNTYYQSLRHAGFNKDTFPQLRDILLISEAEAAATYTARYLKEQCGEDVFTLGESFVLCDAGGGTVDVVGYKVKSLMPNFEIEKMTLSTGARCGSIFINKAFQKWLRRLIGNEYYSQLDENHVIDNVGSHGREPERMRSLMRSFEFHKRKFHRGSRAVRLDLPEPLDNLNLEDRVVGGQITINFEDMKSFFDPCVDTVIDLISGQITQIESLRLQARSVLLVGGFAESEYLQERLSWYFQLIAITLRMPDTSWTAVVRGAAITGIEYSVFSRSVSHTKMCPLGYGIPVNSPFSEIAHNASDMSYDPITNAMMAKSQLEWFVKKGDLLLSDSSLRVKLGPFALQFAASASREGIIPIYGYGGGNDPPDRLARGMSDSDLVNIHTIRYDLRHIPIDEFMRVKSRGQEALLIPVTIEMQIADERSRISLRWKDRNLYTANILSGQGGHAGNLGSQKGSNVSGLNKPSVQLLIFLANLQSPTDIPASPATTGSSRLSKSRFQLNAFKSLGRKKEDQPSRSTVSQTITIFSSSAASVAGELFRALSDPEDASLTLMPGKKRSPLEVRDLNDLIRKRYSLDVDIWSLRKCLPGDRHMVEDKMQRSDASLSKIMATIHLWDRLEDWDSEQSWRKVRRIKDRLEKSGKKLWSTNPPWEG